MDRFRQKWSGALDSDSTHFFCLLWRCLETLLLQCDGNDVQSQGQQEKEEKFLATDQENLRSVVH